MSVAPFSALCSELPNDNLALHEGAVWVPVTPTGWPRAISRPPRAEALRPASEPAPAQGGVVSRAEPTPEPAVAESPEAFQQLVSLLGRVALASGATRAAAVMPAFLDGRVVESSALGDPACRALIGSGHATPAGTGIVMSEALAATAQAWRAVLTGQSADLSSCEATLDSWCADLVAALSGAPSRASELRRELRRFGVAAFGLLASAA